MAQFELSSTKALTLTAGVEFDYVGDIGTVRYVTRSAKRNSKLLNAIRLGKLVKQCSKKTKIEVKKANFVFLTCCMHSSLVLKDIGNL